MAEKDERFELMIGPNGKMDIIDNVESKRKNAICIYNDLGVFPFSSAKAVCDKLNEQEEKLNEQEERIKELESCNHSLAQKDLRKFTKIIELEKENEKLKQRIKEETDRVIKLEQYENGDVDD